MGAANAEGAKNSQARRAGNLPIEGDELSSKRGGDKPAGEGVGDGCDVVQNPVERIESCRRSRTFSELPSRCTIATTIRHMSTSYMLDMRP